MVNPEGHDWASKDWRSYAKEGFSQNPTIYRCINLVATNAASVKPKVKVNGEYVEQHPLLDLLKKPNPITGGQEFRVEAYAWALLTGNIFTERKEVNGRVTELFNYQPYNMEIDRSSVNREIPLAYWTNKNANGGRRWEVDPNTGDCDLMHLAIFNPMHDAGFMGLSPLAAAAMAGDQLNASSKWRYNMLKNDCKPSMAIIGKKATPEQVKQIENKLEKKKGFLNAGKHLFMGGEVEIKPLSLTPKDADYLAGSKFNKQEICEVYGVPTQLLGIEGSQTYANFEEARYALYLLTVLPLVDLYFDELNRWIAPIYGENVEICYDKSQIDALDYVRQRKVEKLLESKILTINEKRDLVGYESLNEADADQVFIDPNLIPIGFDAFTAEEIAMSDAAKAFIRMGMTKDEAETKAFSMFTECQHEPKS